MSALGKQRTKFSIAVGVLGLCLCLFNAKSASASPIVYTGADAGANDNTALTNSNAAEASFASAITALSQTSNIITFESAPLGSFTNLTVASGVSMNGADIGGFSQTVVNAPTGSPAGLFGFNTTSGGSHFVSLFGGTLTFSFATPVDAFGAYLTGVQLTGETITFNDGSSESLAVPNPGSGAEFFGFTDAGNNISSITLNTSTPSSGDIVGVDDVQYSRPGSSSSVPEPSSLGLTALGLVGLMAVVGMKKRGQVTA